MKKKSLSNSLKLKKANIATLNDKNIEMVKGGSTASTSVLAILCSTINPLDCTMSAFCAY